MIYGELNQIKIKSNKMKARSSVHNDQKTLEQIKRKNEEIVSWLIKVKPFIRSSD